MSVAVEQKIITDMEPASGREAFFLSCARMCEFKKCCKKYKHGKRCSKCPKKEKK
jgi:hypothetical protein